MTSGLNFELKQSPLCAALMDDMRQALEAIEFGDYDRAYQILADRCRPDTPLTSIPFELDVRRAGLARQILSMAPQGLLCETDAYVVYVAVEAVLPVLKRPQEIDGETMLKAMENASLVGLTICARGPTV